MTAPRQISSRRGSECSIVAREYDLYKSLGCIDMCRVFDVSKVKVPVIFFGTAGFSARRDARYSSILV